MKLVILVILLVSVFSWNIPLTKVEVQQEGVPITETIYTHDVNYGNKLKEQKIPTIFDITSDATWILESTVCKDCVNSGAGPFNCVQSDNDCKMSSKKGDDSYGFAGQVQFTSPNGPSKDTYIEGKDNLHLAGVELKDVDVQFPVKVLPTPKNAPELDLLKHAQASIGLGHSEGKRHNEDNFTSYIHDGEHSDASIDEKEFSFYYNGEVSQLIFGKPQGFFKTGGWKTLKSSEGQGAQNRNAYNTEFSSVQVDSTKVSLQQSNLKQYAVFTSTSKYISFENADSLQAIVNEINGFTSNKAKCTEKQSNNFYYICNDIIHSLPTLTFNLGGEEFKLSPEDYTEKIEENGETKLLLLLRRGLYGYQNYVQSSLGGSENFVWIGYAFYNRYYVNFQYAKDNYKVQIADKFDFTPAQPQLDSTTRNLFLILGGLATIATVGIILATLKAVPFNGQISKPTQKNNTSTIAAPAQRFATVTSQPVNTVSYLAPSPTKVIIQQSPVKMVNTQPQTFISRTVAGAPKILNQSPIRYVQQQPKQQ